MRRRPNRVLTPVTITRKLPHFRTGQLQAWEAVSKDTDQTWAYHRLEVAGTPWEVLHQPTGVTVPCWYSTLAGAREATADGRALALAKAAKPVPVH